MWDIPNSSIKCLNLGDASLSNGLFFCRDFAVTSSQIHGIGFSKFNHKFAMSLLYNQVGHDLATNVEKSVSGNNPFIAVSAMRFIARFFESCGTCASESILKPIKQAFVGVRDFENRSIMSVFVSIPRLIFKFACMETTLSVNNARKVCQMQRVMGLWFIMNSMFMIYVIESHTTPLFRFTNQYTHGIV